MRKFLAFAALVLGLAACQTEPEGLNVTMGGEQEVTISVAIPEVETRAGDVNSAQGAIANGIVALDDYTIRYALQIFDKDGNASEEIIYKYSDTETVSFPVRLVPEREYTFVVWADIVAAAGVQDGVKSADLHYAIGTTLEEISIIESEWRAMDETRDAFTGKTTLTFNGNNNISIDLYRPFAKLRVVTTDYNELAKFNITPAYAVVKYATPHYSKFNAYESKAVPTNTNAINDKEHSYSIIEWTNEDNSQRTLFADYFFAEDGDIVKFDMSVYEDAAKTTLIKYNNFNTDINVKRNHLTTLKGDILTTGGNVTVTVKPGLEETVKEYKEANSAQDLKNAIDEAEDGEETVIVLGDDIDLSEGIILFSATRANEPQYAILVPAGKVVTLDLNGKTISYSKEQTAAFSMLQNNGTLTITDTKGNGKLSYKDSGNGGEYVSNVVINNNVMTINGGIIENNSVDAVAANGYPHAIDNNGVLTINGGTFSNNSNYSSMRIWCTEDDNTIVTINGGTFNGCIDFHNVSAKPNKGTLTINGGTFNADTYTKSAVRLLGFGTDVDEMVGYINGGTYNGKIALNNYAGGEFNAQVFFITGGTFTTEAKEGTNEALLADGYYFVDNSDGTYGLSYDEVAKVGDVAYKSLKAAIEAVEDGGTITLVNDLTFTKHNRICSGDTWYEGLYYLGDKSFTLDLNGKTITNDSYVNDYLFLLKNDGETENVITFKNGTLEAASSAYCAICTSSTSTKKITVNTENINIIGNNSNGSVVKIRGGAEYNAKVGTIITGKDSYLGIENAAATVNIYDDTKIYMNGTTSYNGCLVGVGYNGTINAYGGYGKGVKGGFIAMTSGGTINVSGGEWIANTNGTIANDNCAVLAAQNDKVTYPNAGKSTINVTGGIFKGGYNYYGLTADAASINIYGGSFNADPAAYVATGYEIAEEGGIYTVSKPKAQLSLEDAIANGGEVKLTADVTLVSTIEIPEGKEVVLDLNGKTVTATSVDAFRANAGTKLTLKNGNINSHGSIVRATGGEIIIESGNYVQTGTAVGSTPATYRYAIDAREGGKISINGGEFKSENGMFNVSADSEIVVNDGKFTNTIEKTMTRHFAYICSKLTINGGEFYGVANSSAGGCFFCGAAKGGDIQITGGKFTSLWTSGTANRIFEVYYGGTIDITGGMFNTNGGITSFVTENTDEATKNTYPYIAK